MERMIGGYKVPGITCPYNSSRYGCGYDCKYKDNCEGNGYNYEKDCDIYQFVEQYNKNSENDIVKSNYVDITGLSVEEAVRKVKNIYAGESFVDSQKDKWNRAIKDQYFSEGVVEDIITSTCKKVLEELYNIDKEKFQDTFKIMLDMGVFK